MFTGYLTLGGTEVLNQSLTYALVEGSDCPPGWIRCHPCHGLTDALGENPGELVIENAPWYDAEDPATHRFFGLYPVEVEGIDGSTRTATITEGILDGGVVQGTRKAVRQVRVRGVMIGRGHDALDAGLSWLDAVLDGDHCSTHPGGGCGEVDACYFITCPPMRPMLPDFSPWTISRTNYNLNPRMDNLTTGWTVGASITSTAQAGGTRLDFGLGLGADVAILSQTAVAAALPGQTWAGSIDVEVPMGFPAVTLYFAELAFTSGGAAIGTPVSGAHVTIAPGQKVRLSTALLTAPATTAGVRTVLFANPAVPVGARIIVSKAIQERTVGTDGSYFDGVEPNNDNERGTWSGAANNSVSWLETRFPQEVPMPDDDYDLLLDPLRRRMHGITAISGPLVIQHFHNDQYHAYEVEFTLAATTPYVFNMPKRLVLSPTVPSVVQDSPFNLVPYPSAELASGSLVLATNYSTNPSVETNVTDWATASDGAVITPAMVTGARSTELFSVGTASFRALFTATTTAANGNFGAQQTVALPTPVTGKRFSINLWASASVQSGTAVISGIEYRAYWQDAASTTLRDDLLGTTPPTGGAVSVKSIAPPAGTTKVVVRARAMMTSWSSGAVVRLYADALAVTVP